MPIFEYFSRKVDKLFENDLKSLENQRKCFEIF